MEAASCATDLNHFKHFKEKTHKTLMHLIFSALFAVKHQRAATSVVTVCLGQLYFKMWGLYAPPICTSCLMNQIDLMGLILRSTKECLQDNRSTSAKSMCWRVGGRERRQGSGVAHCVSYIDPGTINPNTFLPNTTQNCITLFEFFPALPRPS